MYKIRYAEINDAKALGKIHFESWKIAYKGIIPDSVLNNITANKRERYFERANDIIKFLDNNSGIAKYDNELVRRLIQSVKVVSKEKVIVQFKSGQVVESCLL